MTDQRLYCSFPECDEPVAGHGKEACSTHLKQLQRTGTMKPILEKISTEERLILAANEATETDSEESQAKVLQAARLLPPRARRELLRLIVARLTPEDQVIFQTNQLAEAESDDEYQAARKKVLQAARLLAPRVREEILRPPGRPREIDPAEIDRLLKKYANQPGKIFRISRELKCSRQTIWRHVAKRS